MVGTAGAIVITILVLAVVAAIGWVAYTRWRAQKLGLPPPSFTSFLPFLKRDRHSSNSYGAASGSRSGGRGGAAGIGNWFSDTFAKLKNSGNRSAAGAYEGGSGGGYAAGGGAGRGRRGFGALDPDEAWDARVGSEADTFGPGGYYEEQELGLHGGGGGGLSQSHGPYGGGDHHQHLSYELGGGGGGAETYPMNLAATPGLYNAGHSSASADRGREHAPRSNPFDDDAAEPANISLRGVSPRPMDGGQGGSGQKRANSPTGRRSIFTEEV
ncbi:hypothetical protein BD289DRAFT_459777 [Coniella lustricola]|uniref:Acid phosphatase-like protein n=1 Tax=Coniella lustricola TaxID=2025994 RepID=A0A2T3AD38_9PEZI|nr:hypothetical protein BD289DRAFT_459777 [Coniella lustricola]